uniref:Uncharacterized protein n=1 Tax=Tanacetum cinerariifolium TaxID=118510 RepID=A0A6L2MNW9_TANCI|nr:hypothetical protein [Tanacetum cinerariifolium]
MNECMDLKYEDALAWSCILKKKSDFSIVAPVRYAGSYFDPLYHVRDELLEYLKSIEEIDNRKAEVHVEDVEMGENHDVDHLKTKKSYNGV